MKKDFTCTKCGKQFYGYELNDNCCPICGGNTKLNGW